jgi:hypothetical protein
VYKEKLAYDQTPERTAEILSYEGAMVLHEIIYADAFPKQAACHMENMKLELGGMITMSLLLCEQLDLNWNQVVDLGYDQFREKMKTIREGGKT